MPNARGVDVSHHVSIADVAALVAWGCSFVGIKATQGLTFVDPKLVYHRDLVLGDDRHAVVGDQAAGPARGD